MKNEYHLRSFQLHRYNLKSHVRQLFLNHGRWLLLTKEEKANLREVWMADVNLQSPATKGTGRKRNVKRKEWAKLTLTAHRKRIETKDKTAAREITKLRQKNI